MTTQALLESLNTGTLLGGAHSRTPFPQLQPGAALAGGDAQPGDRVALSGWRGTDLLAGVLACWRGGLVPVCSSAPIEPASWPGATTLWSWAKSGLRCLRRGACDPRPPALVHRTSGSTAEARFVRRSAQSLLDEAERYGAAYGLRRAERVFVAAPIDHSFGWGALLGLLAAGLEIEIAAVFNPKVLVDRLLCGQVDVVVLTPTMARLALLGAGNGAVPYSPPRLVIAGAGVVPSSLETAFVQRFGCGLARNYGCAETGATFAGAPGLPAGRLGSPFPGVSIVEPDGTGLTGELVLDLGHRIEGHEGEPRGASGARLWRTGNLVTFDPDGVVLEGRLADRLKLNGTTLDGAALVACALAVPGVDDAAILARPRPERPETEDLVLVVAGPGYPTPDVVTALSAAFPELACWIRVLATAHLPRTPIGKLERRALEHIVEQDGLWAARKAATA